MYMHFCMCIYMIDVDTYEHVCIHKDNNDDDKEDIHIHV
jgi:hypothetical protein